jgi:ribose 5-phosphate isomerase RpiB
MRVGTATDHGGFALREELLTQLRTVGPAVAWDLVQTYLAAQFSQAPRHLRRLAKVAFLESRTA